MSIPLPETAPIEEKRGTRRCLILANSKATRLRWRERITRFNERGARYLGRAARALGLDDGEEEEIVEAPLFMAHLAEIAADCGMEANVELLPSAAQMPGLIRSAQREGYDTIIAAGGDGTVHTVAQHLVHSPMRLGILPVGNANNFAYALGIPSEPEEAMRIIAHGEERMVDVGRIGTEYFTESAGVGFFADVLANYGDEEPRKERLVTMIRRTMPLIWNLSSRSLRLILDDVVQEEHAVMVTVANAPYLGEHFPLAPRADLTDGMLDVVIVGALDRRETLEFAFALQRGKHLDMPKVRYARARTVQIARLHPGLSPLPVHADDHIVTQTPVTIEAMPQALRIFAPPLAATPYEA